MVSGSQLYNVAITISPLRKVAWDAVRSACSGRVGSLIDLLRGKLDRGVMEVVADRREGLFPLPGEMKFTCDCPDWAGMCKHVAAVLYGVGARLDHAPEMLFILRGVNHEELVDVTAAVTDVAKAGTSRRRIVATGIADVFGIDLADAGETNFEAPDSEMKKNPSKKAAKTSAHKPETQPHSQQALTKPVPAKRKNRQKPSGVDTFPDPLTGDAIYAWRSSLAETQAEFACRILVTASSISQWEKKGTATIGVQSRTLSALRKAWRLTH
jgi:uncharacterized Zn finger protein